ncbi:cation diffusion facilitator family transporter [Bifidobacterium subtile]|jgi:cobalt-zinc-cadmium efflux system protein|uniref:cation diffusion facilitator family transporter n=1 Tax=Bifidobacterium subtile TaxID=77635 RepID=UPI002F358F40|nr:cation diffusion facilitator family transporter [Bifidobacterium subtile]
MSPDDSHGSADSSDAIDAGRSHQRRLMMTLALTGTVFVAEVVGAIVTSSLVLLVDAGHMLTDISVLAASSVTAALMRRKPNARRTWGWARLEVLTAAVGALALLGVGFYALLEAGVRLFGSAQTQVHDTGLLLGFGLLGLAANIGSIVILVSQSRDNMNMRAAFLEVMNDALGSIVVVISAIVMMTVGWQWFDAAAGAVVAVLMIPRAAGLLHKAAVVLLEETPQGLDLELVRQHMEHVPHVVAVHDVHASTVATGMPILTAHVVVKRSLTMEQSAAVLDQLRHCLIAHFEVSIPHTTFQLEPEGYASQEETALHE